METLVYPESLRSGNHKSMLSFKPFKRTAPRGSITRQKQFDADNDQLMKQILGTVNLNMPAIGAVNYNQNWDVEGDGTFTQLAKIIKDKNSNFDEKAGKALNKLFENLGGDVRESGALNNETPSIANQRETAKFRGTEMRSQTFDFQLRPRNLNELQVVSKIISFFKFYSASSLFAEGSTDQIKELFKNGALNDASLGENIIQTGGTIVGNIAEHAKGAGDRLNYPPVWKIEEVDIREDKSGASRKISNFKFGPCVCNSVVVNQTPNDYWLSFTNGDPSSIDLSVTFTETSVILANDILRGF